MDVRDRIREIIERKGLTLRGVSLAAGLSDSMLHKFLSGRTKSITVDNLEYIAQALDVSLHYLLLGNPDYEDVIVIWDKLTGRQRRLAKKILKALADDDDSSKEAEPRLFGGDERG